MKLKLKYINLLHSITATVMFFGISGCAKELDELGGIKPSEVISFTISHQSQSTKANATELSGRGMTIYTSGNLAIEEENLTETTLPAVDTKGAPATQLDGTAGIIGYLRGADDVRLWDALNNKEFEFDGDELRNTGTNIAWKEAESEADATHLRIYAFSPKTAVPNEPSATDALSLSLPDNGKNLTDAPTLTYTVPADIDKQQDILVAFTEVTKDFRKSIPLQFNHILTGIRFKAGFECTITSITLKNIASKGTYTMGEKWNNVGELADYSTTVANGTFMLIPQEFEDSYTSGEPVVEMKFTNGSGSEKTLTASLTGQKWEPGKLITYTLYEGTAPGYIFFDLAAGKIDISSDGGYSGYIFVKGSKTEVKGTHSQTNIYYVYQSTINTAESDPTNYRNTGWEKTINTGKCRIPSYKEVMYNGKKWKDFITNNTVVEDVIHAWDSRDSTKGAVRDAGREGTLNWINVHDINSHCNLIIDNLYSKYQHRSVSKTSAGITFNPDNSSSSNLYINSVGDSRFGAILYTANSTRTHKLVFQGNGSITVADTDYQTSFDIGSSRDYIGAITETETTYTSNHWTSAIGNNDSNDHCYGIHFKSGTIFAGTTAAENCSAIGGGGNGYGDVTIDGGVITAVATTTGTAIGGGIGFTSTGGIGDVKINGGDIYAYNHCNRWEIPSSAIGGAGSSKNIGGDGKVSITGGNVYAQSAIGTAIGGGSSQTSTGGNTTVTISGGNIVAKSIAANGVSAGAGIGGGTGCSGGSADNIDGGTAIIKISGNPIIRTGSIGGGRTGSKKGGHIGSAVIEISGTPDIQAQFVMAKGASTAPSFTMTGGTIRNSHTTDEEYIHIQDKGGAVYMEEGELEMTGGTITNCSAVEGGAIYITGGNASIGGNTKIKGNLASAGNGGGVCIYNGNFSMDGTAEISSNSSQFRTLPGKSYGTGGNGGGIYVSSSDNATVSILQGTIKDNTADRNGGGIAVDMSANNDKTATITIGKADAGDADPDISGNTTLILGGGLYASGAKANITINSGKIMGNTTSGYTYNVNVANEGGTVTLNGGNVTHQVVTFNANGGKIDGADTAQQKIVTSTNSLLKAPVPIRTGYIFNGWNTRQDGNGTTYSDGATMNLSADLTLYAQWLIIQ